MKLTVLMDNNTFIDRYYLGEPAASYLLETEGKAFLLDAGYSACTLENARRMGVDLARVTDIALSHGHNDHTGGLPALLPACGKQLNLWAHPDAFLPKRYEGLPVGLPFDPAILQEHEGVRLCFSRTPQELAPGVLFLGEIPRANPLEGLPLGETLRNGRWEPDRLLDDTALALTTQDGLFLLTGCSHAGICNMLQYAAACTGQTRIAGILGGMHLFAPGAQLDFVLERFAELGVKTLYPCHCTSLAVKHAFCSAFDVQEVGVGLSLTI